MQESMGLKSSITVEARRIIENRKQLIKVLTDIEDFDEKSLDLFFGEKRDWEI